MERRLAAILAADMVGYSKLVEADETGTLSRQKRYISDVINPKIEKHHGHVVKWMGDGLLAEFQSVVEAVQCAVSIQSELKTREAEIPEDRRIRYRIGVNLGDVIFDGGDVFGDGVNIAARLEAFADPGGVIISGTAYDQLKANIDVGYESLGQKQIKNMSAPVRVYKVVPGGKAAFARTKRHEGFSQYWRAGTGVIAAVFLALLVATGVWFWTVVSEDSLTNSLSDPALEMPSGPSIAVLPLKNLSGNPDQDYFADGMTEEITTALSRFRELLVLARSTMFEFKDYKDGVEDIGNALGVDYVLEGSVRKSTNRIRITARLVDVTTGAHIWAENYDRAISDVFQVQDEIAQEIAGTLGGQYGKLAEARRLKKAPTTNIEAYDYVLRSLKWWYNLSPENHLEAREYLEKAVALDPYYAQAQAHLSNAYLNEYVFGFNPRENSRERAGLHAKRAVELDPSDAFCRYMLARYYFFNGELQKALVETNKALELNPNEPTALAELGFHLNYSGLDPERGLQLVKKAMKINPAHPGWFYFVFTYHEYKNRDYEAALEYARKINTPRFYRMHLVQAMALGQLERQEEAQAAISRMLELRPSIAEEAVLREDFYKWNFPVEVVDHFIEGLQKAGLRGT